jgi:uncharacterized delta-60 repeat protein
MLNPDGTIDESFGTAGKVIINGDPINSGNLYAADIGPNDQIILCGNRQNPFNSIGETFLVKLNKNGSLDESFGTLGKLYLNISPINSLSEGYDVKFLSDGKILVAIHTRFASGNPGLEFSVAKLNADGSFDNSFGDGGKKFIVNSEQPDTPYRMAIQQDGKILIAGLTSVDGISKFKIVRLDANGNEDISFGNNGTSIIDRGTETTPNVRDMIILSNGKILITGNLSIAAGNSKLTIAKLNSDGSIDDTFGENGIKNIIQIDMGNKLLEDNDGNIIAIGRSFDEVKIAKLNSNGEDDLNFGTNGVASLGTSNPSSNDLTGLFLTNDRVLIGGSWTNNGKNNYSVVKVKFASSSNPTTIENLNQKSISFFPNPTKGLLYFNTDILPISLELFDLSGRSVYNSYQSFNSTIDISHINNGVYLLKSTCSNGSVSSTRIIKN